MPAPRTITTLTLAIALPLASGAMAEDAEEAPNLRKIPAISMLPDGSELEGVVLPRYDQFLRLTGALHARKLILVGPELIHGEGVLIDLLDPDQPGDRTRIELGTAILDQTTGVIRGDEEVTIASARFTATGQALHFTFEEGRGFVTGPATTLIHATPRKTAMHTSSTPRHPILATAAMGMAVATSTMMVQARPPAVSDAEIEEIRGVGASSVAGIQGFVEDTRQAVGESRQMSDEISQAARTYLVNQVLESGEAPAAAPERPEAKPLEVEAKPDDTRILSDGGFYFDAEEGVLVYLENVRVTDPRYSLEGVDELRVIFEKKPKPEAGDEPAQAEDNDGGPASGFAAGVGDVERIIATGRVLFKQRNPEDGGPPVEASGALFNYNVTTGEIILSGGYPWVRQGNYYARALQPNLNLRIRADGSFVTEGNWDTGQSLRR